MRRWQRKFFVLPTQIMRRGDAGAALARRAAPAARAARCRRPGAFLPRRPGRDGRPRRGRRHAGLQLDPASDRGAASRRARAEAVATMRWSAKRGAWAAAFGGKEIAGLADRRGRRAAGAADRTAGEAAARPRRRHDADRQAPRFPHRLRCRLRRRRPHPGHRVRAGRAAAAIRPTCPARSATGRCSMPTTPIISTNVTYRFAPLQDQHGVEHRVPRLRRAAGHDGDRARDRRDRAPSATSIRWRCASATSTARATATSRRTT